MSTNSFLNTNEIQTLSRISSIILQLESDYINKHYQSFPIAKQETISHLISSLSADQKEEQIPSNSKTISLLSEIHKTSISKGGFLTISNRAIIYSFFINTWYSQYISKEEVVLPSHDWENLNIYDDIIDKDCDRSVWFTIIQQQNYTNYFDNQTQNEFINILKKFTKLVIFSGIDYFQGFQELALYFLIIFGFDTGPIYLIKFTKWFLNYITNSKYKKVFTFDHILDILNECCNNVNHKVNTVICRITKTKPYYSLSWWITFFTHNNNDLFHEMRLLDYFVTSNISNIFFFSAIVIVTEFNSWRKRFHDRGEAIDDDNIEELSEYMSEIFMHFQKLKWNNLNVEGIIIEWERTKCQKQFVDIVYSVQKQNEGLQVESGNEVIRDLSKVFVIGDSGKSVLSGDFWMIIIMILLFWALSIVVDIKGYGK